MKRENEIYKVTRVGSVGNVVLLTFKFLLARWATVRR